MSRSLDTTTSQFPDIFGGVPAPDKSEARNPKPERIPKFEARNLIVTSSTAHQRPAFSDLGFRISFGFRASAFGFPSFHSLKTSKEHFFTSNGAPTA
ncbi:MAG: hypothetical protein ACLQUR_17040 [Limisphaerales bacterium]